MMLRVNVLNVKKQILSSYSRKIILEIFKGTSKNAILFIAKMKLNRLYAIKNTLL